MKHHNQKQFGEEMVYFSHTFEPEPGDLSQNLEAGVDAEGMDERCSLACSLEVVQLLSFLKKLYKVFIGIIKGCLQFEKAQQKV